MQHDPHPPTYGGGTVSAYGKQRTPVDQIEQPTYEQEVRGAATWLRKKADGFLDLPSFAVTLSPDFARWIAQRLDNHADDVELRHG